MAMHKKYRSPLAKLQNEKTDYEKIKKQGWEQNGILVINVDDERLSWPEKEIIKQIGNRIYQSKTKKNNGKTTT
jgi:hypothetical protein